MAKKRMSHVLPDVAPFADKRILCFQALSYHARILLPVMRALEARGATVEYCTSQAEAAFEITFQELGLPFLHTSDFVTPAVAEKITTAYAQLSRDWQRLMLGDAILQSVPLVIIDKILRAMVESYYAFERMIDERKPDLVFSLHELNSWGKILGYLAHTKGIPFFTFQEGLCYSAVPMYRWHTEFSQACMLWGEADRDVLIAANNDPAKMPIVGNIDLAETVREANRPERIAQVRADYQVADDQEIVLFLMGHAAYQQFQAPEFIKWLWEHREIVPVFKFHPIQGADVVRSAMSILGQIPSVRSLVAGDTYGLLAAAKACVLVGASTTGIEALAFGKPLVEIPLPDQTYSYAAQGTVPQAPTLEAAVVLALQIAEAGVDSEWYAAREAYLQRHFLGYTNGEFDQGTVERVVQVIAERMQQGPMV